MMMVLTINVKSPPTIAAPILIVIIPTRLSLPQDTIIVLTGCTAAL
jgi:hypothetical protein